MCIGRLSHHTPLICNKQMRKRNIINQSESSKHTSHLLRTDHKHNSRMGRNLPPRTNNPKPHIRRYDNSRIGTLTETKNTLRKAFDYFWFICLEFIGKSRGGMFVFAVRVTFGVDGSVEMDSYVAKGGDFFVFGTIIGGWVE